MLRTAFIVAATVVLAACAHATPAGSDTVGPGYVTGGGTWNTGGGISAAVRVLKRGGATVVCGAWTTDRQSALTVNHNRDVMAAGSVYLAGTRLVQGLGFMARVPYSNNIAGASANCVASSVPWRPAFADARPKVRFPRLVFSEAADEGTGGGNAAIFRQTSRPDIVG